MVPKGEAGGEGRADTSCLLSEAWGWARLPRPGRFRQTKPPRDTDQSELLPGCRAHKKRPKEPLCVRRTALSSSPVTSADPKEMAHAGPQKAGVYMST